MHEGLEGSGIEVKEGSDPLSYERRWAQVCKDQSDKELLNLTWRIYFEGTAE
uniref:Predicted protein n=1 Tax=Hordeum vulgare subsp. vulgare TaxID=112509 RepID=F2D194_HORVV|nr:predicted protein [Hordeum vulgare subsp. vulgare]